MLARSTGTTRSTGPKTNLRIENAGHFFVGSTFVAVQRLDMVGWTVLDGPGTLTVNAGMTWRGGTLRGEGKTVLAKDAVLTLLGEEARVLSGRQFVNYGQTVWDGSGRVGRMAAGGPEWFDNTGLRADAGAAGFSAVAVAGKLYRAMFGGLTGLGTDEDAIFEALQGRSPAQRQAIADAYFEAYRKQLSAHLADELDDSEWTRAQGLMLGNNSTADAAALHYAMKGNTGAGTNEDTIWRILDDKPHAVVLAIQTAYDAEYTSATLRQAFDGELSGYELTRAKALLDGDQVLADAAALKHAMHGGLGLDTDEATIYRILGRSTPDHIAAIKAKYLSTYNKTLDQDLQGVLTLAEYDLAKALMTGDPIAGAVATIRQATGWLGYFTDEDAVWSTLKGVSAERRAAVAQAYHAKYGQRLPDLFRVEFSDNFFTGDELEKTLILYESGGLTPAERLYFAMKGLGTDVAVIREVLTGRSSAQIEDVKLEYGAKFGETLLTAIRGDLSGRDLLDVEQLLAGATTDLGVRLTQLEAKRDYERGLLSNWVGVPFLDAFSNDGRQLNSRLAHARATYDLAMADGTLDASERQRIEKLLSIADEDLQTYREHKDALAGTAGTVLATAAGMAVVWASAGTAIPLAVVLLYAGGAGALGQVLGNVVVAGQTYDVEMLPGQAFEGFLNGASSAITFSGMPNASTVLGRVLQGATAGALEGAAGGFVGGVTGAMLQDGVWSEGLWKGLMTAGEAGAIGALTGGLTGGLLGGALSVSWAKLLTACFVAGTPLLTPAGCKRIEDFRPGDLLLSRPEHDPDGRAVAKAVEEVFVNTGRVLELRVGGRAIETTPEHPFFVEEKGWVEAGQLRPGDVLVGHGGGRVEVEGVRDTGEYATVYNLRVADWHTYYVGSPEWGFDVWAHNTNGTCLADLVKVQVKGPSVETSTSSVYKNLGNLRKAVEEAKAILNAHGYDADASRLLTQLRRRLKEVDEAIHLADGAVQLKLGGRLAGKEDEAAVAVAEVRNAFQRAREEYARVAVELEGKLDAPAAGHSRHTNATGTRDRLTTVSQNLADVADNLPAKLGKQLSNELQPQNWTSFLSKRYGGLDAEGRTLAQAEALAATAKQSYAGTPYENADWPMHAHHIVMRNGPEGCAAEVANTHALLRRYDVDPYYSKENLIWAPNRGHTAQMGIDTYNEILAAVNQGGTDAQIRQRVVNKLKEIGDAYLKSTRWRTGGQ